MVKIKGMKKLIGRLANQILRVVSNKLSDSVNREQSINFLSLLTYKIQFIKDTPKLFFFFYQNQN